MKKIVALLVIVFSIISFSSCTEEDTSSNKPLYTNISLKDAQMYVGLERNVVEDMLESKGYFFKPFFVDALKYPPPYYSVVYINSDNTVWYELLFTLETNIIFQVNVFKKSIIRNNSISNYEYCQRECMLATNNNTDYQYTGYIYEAYDSQSEFQNVFDANKSIIDYCIEGWNSTNISFSVSFIERNEENSNVTETSTIVQSDKYYLFNVGYSDRSYQWK
ncbi:MAG: hypothetical protein PHY75_06105 [Bacteroidales bacterium]|nr:hypothetical protein [Bacteroidales bacterium]MEA5098981.1 hypothetical protein [Bacteroidales bacterium]